MRAVEWSAVEEESKKNYSLLSSVDPYGNRWRMEFTPIADFRMCLDNETLSSFSFKLPMIPGSLLSDAYLFLVKCMLYMAQKPHCSFFMMYPMNDTSGMFHTRLYYPVLLILREMPHWKMTLLPGW